MRGSVKGQVNYILKQIDGIGESKAQRRSESNLRSIDNARAVSDKIHSYRYKDEVFKTARQLGEFAREYFNIKDFEKIDGKVIEAFFEQKISEGVSRSTLENYISHLSKVEIGLKKIADNLGREYTAFTREDLNNVRELVQTLDKNEYENRAYNNPYALISNLNEKEYIVGRLQLEYGLRVSEATYIKENQLNGNTLVFQGKGGYIQTKELSPDLANSIKEHMQNGIFYVDQNEYREALKRISNY